MYKTIRGKDLKDKQYMWPWLPDDAIQEHLSFVFRTYSTADEPTVGNLAVAIFWHEDEAIKYCEYRNREEENWLKEQAPND